MGETGLPESNGFPIIHFRGVIGKFREHQFSLDEFARLVLILWDDEQTRNDLSHATDMELTRQETNNRETRDSIWASFSQRYNNPTLKGYLNLTEDWKMFRIVNTLLLFGKRATYETF